jgi:peptidoglycan L-alanyl-D-glutamate endopeptidase CwlK
MAVLEEGDKGAAVTALQSALKQKGFSPGAVDGDFGPGTEAAVLAFQKSNGLTANGIVGPETASALELTGGDGAAPPDDPPAGAPMPAVPVSIVAKMFPATPLDNIKVNLPFVLTALERSALTSKPMILVAVGTIRAETESFEPISEGRSRFNTSPGGAPFDLYDHRKDLGNRGPTDGADYRGRGYVQLTGRANYLEFGPRIGVSNLADQPHLANDPGIAGQLLASFLLKHRTGIEQALANNDLTTVRRLVNGGSNGLDRFVDAFKIGARLL